MLMDRAVVLRPRRRRRVIKIDRYRDGMEDRVGPGVGNEAEVRPDQ